MADKVDVTIVAGPNVTVMVTVRIMVEEIPQPPVVVVDIIKMVVGDEVAATAAATITIPTLTKPSK